MLSPLLVTLYNSTDISQQGQTLAASSFLQINSTANLEQSYQSAIISAYFQNQSTVQATQSLNSQAFIQIDATISATQAAQSIAISAWYYDIGIDANIVQPQQSTQSVGFISLSLEASVSQPMQYMAASSTTAVITAPSPIVVMTRDRILRNIRNRGSR
jgi:hypothetical protein